MAGVINPLHNDEKFALSKGLDGKVAYSLLTVSFFSTLCGVYLPREQCLIQEVNYKFMKPVYSGDNLLVESEVTERDERTKQLILKVRIRRKSDNSLMV